MKIEYAFIKSANDFCNNEDSFKSYLMANGRLKFGDNDTLIIDNKSFEYELKKYQIEQSKEVMFYFAIETELGSDNEEAKVLEKADELIVRINVKMSQFQITTIYDEVSMYYEGYLYPKISRVENTLRKLIYLFMMKKVGSAWYKKETPPEFQKSIENVKDKNNADDEANALMYADFITLNYFFFSKYAFNNDSQLFIEQMSTPDNRKEEQYQELRKKFEKKSNWDRYFSDKIKVDDFSGKWEKLYGYRNSIAHNKKLKSADVDDAMSIINLIQPALEKCINNIDAVKLDEEETAAVQEVARKAITEVEPVIRKETLRPYSEFPWNLGIDWNERIKDIDLATISIGQDYANKTIRAYENQSVNQVLKAQILESKNALPQETLTAASISQKGYLSARTLESRDKTLSVSKINNRIDINKPITSYFNNVHTSLDIHAPNSLSDSQKQQLHDLSNLPDDTVRKEAETDPDCEPLDEPGIEE